MKYYRFVDLVFDTPCPIALEARDLVDFTDVRKRSVKSIGDNKGA